VFPPGIRKAGKPGINAPKNNAMPGAKKLTPRTISHDLSVSEQIELADVAHIAAAGFKSIICNRPDGEGKGQTDFPLIDAAAQKAGLATAYLPVVSGAVGDKDAEAFGKLLDTLPKPVFAYCRTGTRCSILWSLSQGARGRPLPEILGATANAGYDMSAIATRIISNSHSASHPSRTAHAADGK
jgi:sulfide:quinone oxidoreductase